MLGTLFYGTDPRLLGPAIGAVLVLAAEAGFRIGRRHAKATGGSGRSPQVTTLEAAILGLLTLVLSFTYSGSYSRFDTRRQVIIQEANAIETAYLRAGMMPQQERERTRDLLRRYASIQVPSPEALERALAETKRLQQKLWREAERFSRSGADAGRKALLVSAINQTIDLHTSRLANFLFHAPASLLLILNLGAALAVLFMGYASGLDNQRFWIGQGVMIVLLTVLLVVILDLENSQKGAIQPSRQPLFEVQQSIGAPGFGRPPPEQGAGPGKRREQ